MKAKIFTFMTSLLLLGISGHAFSENFNESSLKSTACEQCHGHDGNSSDSALPSLAGQNLAYLVQQMNSFLQGNRKHPLLGSSAKKTSDVHIEFLATHYSNLKVKNIGTGSFSDSFTQMIKQGESIYSPCSGCHGTEAEGITPYPRLAGQQADYLKQQIAHFKTGKRDNMIMQMMTINLSDKDVNALVLYLSTLN